MGFGILLSVSLSDLVLPNVPRSFDKRLNRCGEGTSSSLRSSFCSESLSLDSLSVNGLTSDPLKSARGGGDKIALSIKEIRDE